MDKAEDKLRLFNLRFFPLFAAFLILGIFTVKVSLLVAVILWVVAIFIALTLLFMKRVSWFVALALVVTVFLGYGLASLELHYRNEVGLRGWGEVTCRVTGVTESDGEYVVAADHLSAEGKSFSGGVAFMTDTPLSVGDRVTFYGEVRINMLSLESISSALQYRKGYKYTATCRDVIRVEEGARPLSYTVKQGAKDILIKYQGQRAGGFSYAMLFGDGEEMLEEDKSAMREVGVAHVFAISGLHVAVLAGVILFILRKCKVKDGVALLVLLPVFGFYAYLVGFSPSVLRAAIMVTLSLAASHFGLRYDDISALGFAAILLLLSRPLLLFDVSFIMSFLAVFGIQSLASPLKKAFISHKMNEKLAGALALSIAATLAILPVSAVVFGRIAFIGILLNLVVVPLCSVSYVITLFGQLLTAAYSGFGAILGAVKYLPLIICDISAWASLLGLSEKYDFGIAELLVYYAILAFTGKYSLASKKLKLVTGGMGAGVLAILIFAL